MFNTHDFNAACISNNLELAKQIISVDIDKQINIHYGYENEKLFIKICKLGYFDIIKYLVSLKEEYGKMKIHTFNYAFHGSCVFGDLNIVTYLISLEHEYYKIDQYTKENAFAASNNLDILKYLISLDTEYEKINIDTGTVYSAFEMNCMKQNLDNLKYLVSLSSKHEYGPININVIEKRYLKYTFIEKPLHILEYLCNLDDKYEIIDSEIVILTEEEIELKYKKRCIVRLETIKKKLLLKSWHPTRFMEWCLDITDYLDIN
jgi:hypothetical protein